MNPQNPTDQSNESVSQAITVPSTAGTPPFTTKRSKLSYPERAVRLAVMHLGKSEVPLGTNRVLYNRYWGGHMDGVPWCASFLSYILDRVGNQNHQIAWDNPYAVASIAAWAAENNHFVATPRRGDLYLIQNATMSHTGFVRKVDGTRFLDVSGNTTMAGRRGAYYVASKWRSIRGCRFVRLPNHAF